MKVILLTAIEYAKVEEEEVATEEHFTKTADKSISDNEVQGEPSTLVAVIEATEAWNKEKRNTEVQLGPWNRGLRALG